MKIAHKWGFGMAPPKAATLRTRRNACENVMDLLHRGQFPRSTDETLDALSIVKGLFNRIVREDQWDWFTVCGQLGYPSRRIAQVIAFESSQLRSAIKSGDVEMFARARTQLVRLPTRRCLAVYLGQSRIAEEPGAGWIYVLSTRELPELLKIGMTTRRVEQRAQEINAVTGVVIPFGIRRCWRVFEPVRVEMLVHQALQKYRVRNDREFFHISFKEAAKILGDVIEKSGSEIRTLNALTVLEN